MLRQADRPNGPAVASRIGEKPHDERDAGAVDVADPPEVEADQVRPERRHLRQRGCDLLIGRFDEPAGRRVALVAHTGRLLAELEPAERTVFVLGAEREGLPREVAAACDAVAAIPIAESAESLNVAVAGAIALYEARRLPSTAATTSAASPAAAGEAPAAP